MSFPDDAYTRRAGAIADQTIERSFPIYAELKSHLLRLIRSETDFNRAAALLDESGIDSHFLKEDTELLFDSMATIEATGRSFIVEKDRFYSHRSHRLPASFRLGGVFVDYLDVGWFLCADGVVKISFDLIPQEAVEYLRKKALTIASIENDELLKAIKEKLIEAAEQGKTFSQFEEEADALFATFGTEPLSSRRLQTVFRTNLFSAYSIGQLEQINEMPDAFPLWRYVSILDSSTRPDHRALNGKIFRLGEGPYPPIDYNCRCSAQHIHSSEVTESGLNPSAAPQLPDTVRRFDVQSDFNKWAAKKKAGMNPKIRERLDRGE